MKKYSKLVPILAVLLLLASNLFAADLTSATCPGTGCVDLSVSGQGSIAIQITNTWSGTITFQGSIDNVTFTSLRAVLASDTSSTGVTTTTGNGIFQATITGLSKVRVKFTSFSSGTATVVMRSTTVAGKFSGAGGGGSGAPSDATYITQTPNSTLSAEQALSGLATGILKSTTTTGVVSTAVHGTDYLTFPDLASPPGGTALGSLTAGYDFLNVGGNPGTDGNVVNYEHAVPVIISADGGGLGVVMYGAGGDADTDGGAFLGFMASRGTRIVPLPTLSGDYLGEMDFLATDSGNGLHYGATIYVQASEDWTPTARGVNFYFSASKNGATGGDVNFLEFEGDDGAVTLGRSDTPTGVQGSTLAFTGAAVFNSTVTATDFIIGSTSIKLLQGTTASIGGGLLAGAGSCATGTATVTGAVVGKPVFFSTSDGTAVSGLVTVYASVTSTNTVTLQVCAIAAVTPAAKTYNVAVAQ